MEHSRPRLRDTVSALATPSLCVISGIVWAYAGVAATGLLVAQQPDDYDAGNRFAFAVAFVVLCSLCPAACSIAYFVAREAGWQRVRALGISQFGGAIVAAGLVMVVLLA